MMTTPAHQPTHHQPSFQLSRRRPQPSGSTFALGRKVNKALAKKYLERD